MKKLGYILLMLPVFLGMLEAGIKSSREACPMTKVVVPEEIIAGHDGDMLMKMVKKTAGLKWESGNTGESVRFIFKEKAVLKRLQLSITLGEGTDGVIIVQFHWIPKDKWWGQIIGDLEIIPDGTEHCYFLESQTMIPENVDVKEFILFFPADAVVTSLRFSDLLSEKPL